MRHGPTVPAEPSRADAASLTYALCMDNDDLEPDKEILLPYPRKWVVLERLEQTPIGLIARDFEDLYFADEGQHPWSFTLSELKRDGHVRIAGLIHRKGQRPHSVYVITPAGRTKLAEIRARYGSGDS